MNLKVEDTKEGLKKLIFNWIFLSLVILLTLFLTFKMYYYKHLWEKVNENEKILEENLDEAELLIKKYQIQLQRALGNLSLLEEEINKLKNDLKAVKNRNAQYRIENEQLKKKIKELENKIEALL
jgi:peptidoglycan hydrolase CwlO-like protein